MKKIGNILYFLMVGMEMKQLVGCLSDNNIFAWIAIVILSVTIIIMLVVAVKEDELHNKYDDVKSVCFGIFAAITAADYSLKGKCPYFVAIIIGILVCIHMGLVIADRLNRKSNNNNI